MPHPSGIDEATQIIMKMLNAAVPILVSPYLTTRLGAMVSRRGCRTCQFLATVSKDSSTRLVQDEIYLHVVQRVQMPEEVAQLGIHSFSH
jgi:hypothetical protein